jgi:cytochrome c-type biogenesis protein CcmH
MAVVLAVALVVGSLRTTETLTAQDRVTAIAETVKCPTCQGESVADSNAEVSKAIRRDIAERVAAGQTDDQIRAFYAATYGDAILLTPPAEGVSALVWVLPVVAVSAAVAGLVLVFRRWRRPAAGPSDADRALVAEALRARDGGDDLGVRDGGDDLGVRDGGNDPGVPDGGGAPQVRDGGDGGGGR